MFPKYYPFLKLIKKRGSKLKEEFFMASKEK